ncbi:hypothetical protein PoB_001118600 [Plakobranchus ocellatus]|uniref:Uncharacterized protein n=1 Tax=Plakobranchus ocellatus TaxID=259542 RepID=A0AAV3YBH4_9GAST|nr:hypothetical protein PoB_001118600 [Plakobranchus ocellatus]
MPDIPNCPSSSEAEHRQKGRQDGSDVRHRSSSPYHTDFPPYLRRYVPLRSTYLDCPAPAYWTYLWRRLNLGDKPEIVAMLCVA